MVKIFVYSNGYATLLTERLRECHEQEPDVFKIYEVSEEDYKLYQQGTHICVDGKPQEIPKPTVDPLVELKRDYEEQKKELIDAMQSALLEGDDELIKSIREDLQDLKDAYKEGVENAKAQA